jgi:hypothetical protein
VFDIAQITKEAGFTLRLRRVPAMSLVLGTACSAGNPSMHLTFLKATP